MIRNCDSCCISGVWNYSDMIGAKAKIKSIPVYNRFGKYSGDDTHTIEDLIFRVDETGKTICVVKLSGLEGDFTFKDLEITSLMPLIPICSEELICGTVIING